MTAKKLLAELRNHGCEPGAVGFSLRFETDPPDHLGMFLEVLHTGVRALITGNRWHSFDEKTGKACGPFPTIGRGPLAFGALDPSQLLPRNVGYLCVGGDPEWDRIPAFAKVDVSAVFEPDLATLTSRKAVAK